MITIIDYGLGNLFSITNALKKVGVTASISSNRNEILEADGIILPGVGAFGEAMQRLSDLQLIDTLTSFNDTKKPILGICLGMQLLFSKSEEFGNHSGLNFIQGNVLKFPNNNSKVPQVGWNNSRKINSNNSAQNIFSNIPDHAYFYFVHSYYVDSHEPNCTLTETIYDGLTYTSSIQKNHISATQFHPEKSHIQGLKLLKNWTNMVDEHKKLRKEEK